MGMGIGGFYAQATQRDFSRDFQMRVIDIGSGILTENDNVFITTANLPGYAITNQDTPFMGLIFHVPGSATFPGSEAWAVTFRADQSLNIRQRIVNWQKSIFDAFPGPTQSVGDYAPKGEQSLVKLIIHDRNGAQVRGIQLVGAWPTTIGDMAYDQTGNGAIVTIPVTLAYQWWQPLDSEGNFNLA